MLHRTVNTTRSGRQGKNDDDGRPAAAPKAISRCNQTVHSNRTAIPKRTLTVGFPRERRKSKEHSGMRGSSLFSQKVLTNVSPGEPKNSAAGNDVENKNRQTTEQQTSIVLCRDKKDRSILMVEVSDGRNKHNVDIKREAQSQMASRSGKNHQKRVMLRAGVNDDADRE